MVGHCDHDHCGLWRCGAQDLSGHVRGRPLRFGRRADHRPARARHRQQLLHVLLPHSGWCLAWPLELLASDVYPVVCCFYSQARSKLPKKRRRVLPVEQPRRKREPTAPHRGRANAFKQTPPTGPGLMAGGGNPGGAAGAGGGGGGGGGGHAMGHPAAGAPMFKDAFGGAKIGELGDKLLLYSVLRGF